MTDNRESPETLDRRHFVRTLGGAIVGSGLVACEAIAIVEQPGELTGTVEVGVSGLTPQEAAGTVTVTEPDGSNPGIDIQLPDADAQGVSLGVATDVPVGTYRITYTPPANHVIADPDDFEDVTVQANQTARAEFTCLRPGTVEVRVSGLAPQGAAGTVTVTEPDGSNPGIDIPLPDADAQGVSLGVATDVPVGTYRITYGAPASHAITDTDNFEDVTVQTDQTVRAEFTVEEKPQPPLAFASDWGTARGTSNNAISNGSQWGVSGSAGPTARVEVVSASGLDFPSNMNNVLRLRTRQEGPPFGRGLFLDDQFTTLAIGETRYWRLYYRNDTVVSPGDGTHHVQMTRQAGAIWFWWNFRPDGTTTIKQHFDMKYIGLNGPYLNNWRIDSFQHNKTYRCEWAINRLAAEFCHLEVRVYNSSDVLEFDNTDLWDNLHSYFASSNPHDGEEAGANSRVPDVAGQGGWDNTQDFYIGLDGSEFGSDLPCYYGGFAVSNVNWCGPYASGEGP